MNSSNNLLGALFARVGLSVLTGFENLQFNIARQASQYQPELNAAKFRPHIQAKKRAKARFSGYPGAKLARKAYTGKITLRG